jgi:hypothetical protein
VWRPWLIPETVLRDPRTSLLSAARAQHPSRQPFAVTSFVSSARAVI